MVNNHLEGLLKQFNGLTPIVSESVSLCEVCDCVYLTSSQMILTLLGQRPLFEKHLPYKIECDLREKKNTSVTVVTHVLCLNRGMGLSLNLCDSLEVMTRNYNRNDIWRLWYKLLLYTAPIHTASSSFCMCLVSFHKQKVYYAMQNCINRGFFFAGRFFFPPSSTFNLLSKV